MKNTYYITNAIPYVNAKPHVGHALEFIQSDVIARYHKSKGENVLLLCGADENALKNVQAAEKAGIPIQQFVDTHAKEFEALAQALHVHFDIFQKGSDPLHHYISSQKLWKLCMDSGDIYKKLYTGLYCLGCELFYTKDELNEHGECYEHPGKQVEQIEEENYFFRLSKYKQQLITLIETNELMITPTSRKNEILQFLQKEVEDISISRSNTRAKNWGVPIPGDDSQRMYVWFDALNIYQSGIGFGWDETTYATWWPASLHVIGKGIIRFHAIYWPALLLSAQLPTPRHLFVHDYITVNGQKMAKSLGNVIDPTTLIASYGAEAVRFYCLRYFSPFSDGDFSEEKLRIAYNADLANGLGNLIARVHKLYQRVPHTDIAYDNTFYPEVEAFIQEFKFNDALFFIWEQITGIDRQINQEKPWTLENDKLHPFLTRIIGDIAKIAYNIAPFLPVTSQTILDLFSSTSLPLSPSLFPRKG